MRKPLKRPAPRRARPKYDGEINFAIQCKAYQLPDFVRQFEFAREMERKFASDFCFKEFKLLVEIQGGIFRRGGGAHSSPLAILRDNEKIQHAALLGYWMLPFSTDEVKSGHAVQWTAKVLNVLGYKGSLFP